MANTNVSKTDVRPKANRDLPSTVEERRTEPARRRGASDHQEFPLTSRTPGIRAAQMLADILALHEERQTKRLLKKAIRKPKSRRATTG